MHDLNNSALLDVPLNCFSCSSYVILIIGRLVIWLIAWEYRPIFIKFSKNRSVSLPMWYSRGFKWKFMKNWKCNNCSKCVPKVTLLFYELNWTKQYCIMVEMDFLYVQLEWGKCICSGVTFPTTGSNCNCKKERVQTREFKMAANQIHVQSCNIQFHKHHFNIAIIWNKNLKLWFHYVRGIHNTNRLHAVLQVYLCCHGGQKMAPSYSKCE